MDESQILEFAKEPARARGKEVEVGAMFLGLGLGAPPARWRLLWRWRWRWPRTWPRTKHSGVLVLAAAAAVTLPHPRRTTGLR